MNMIGCSVLSWIWKSTAPILTCEAFAIWIARSLHFMGLAVSPGLRRAPSTSFSRVSWDCQSMLWTTMSSMYSATYFWWGGSTVHNSLKCCRCPMYSKRENPVVDSTAEVADIFNVSQRQVQRIRKRYEETGDVFDKPRSGRPRMTTAREDRFLARKSKASPFSTAAELHETWSPEVPLSTRTVCRIRSRNGLHGRISAQKAALNKRQLKNRVAFAKAHSLPTVWTLEFLRWIFCWITSQSPQILQETYWSPHGSEIHPENSQVWWRKNHGLGLHPVWGCARDLQGGKQHQ